MSTASVIGAVSTDTFGGLSGYKRTLQGAPVRVPSNLPAFRGAKNNPGSEIKAPVIKSSSNRPSRGTNITIPYARTTPLDHTANLGRLAPGDIAFVSRDGTNIPGYAHSRYTRLLGVDALNRFLSAPYWNETDGQNYRHILLESQLATQGGGGVADSWRAVPFLGEWSCDGVVMSNEEPSIYHGSGSFDNQLFNIAIQGICPVNNGFVDANGMGQLSRSIPSNASDHGKYTGTNYHLYPLQMFDRDVSPLHELFVGLVATRHLPPSNAIAQAIVTAKTQIREAKAFLKTEEADAPREAAAAFATIAAAEAELNKLDAKVRTTFKEYQEAGWVSGATVVGGPNEPFYSFKHVLFTTRNMEDLNVYNADTNPGGIDIFVPAGGQAVKRLKTDYDQYDSVSQRTKDFEHMVGAWRLGKVIDVKAQKMPHFAGGPSETGYRVTTNIDIEWCDWRSLRRKFTNSAGATQIGETLKGAARWADAEKDDNGVKLMWPTAYDSKNPEAPKNPGDGGGGGAAAAVAAAAPTGVVESSALSLLRTSKQQVLPELPARGVTPEHHMARIGVAMANVRSMMVEPNEQELDEAIAFASGPEAAAAKATIQAAAVSSSAAPAPPSKKAGKKPVVHAATGSAATSSSAAPPPAAVPALPAAEQPPAASSGSRRARSASTASDVFSTIFGGNDDATQPLNPSHRASPGGGTTGRSFSRRKTRDEK
jgi:hypothetical protein